MAKGKQASTPAAAETAEAESTTRVGVLHQAHADYIKEQKGVDVTAEQVFAVYSTRVPFRKSDAYQTGVRQAKADAKAAALKAKEEAAATRKANSEAKAKEKADAKAAKAAEAAKTAEAAPAAKTTTATKKTAASAKGKKGKGGKESPF